MPYRPSFSTWIPMISSASTAPPSARALLTMNDYIHEDPGRLETVANIAAVVTARMGQGELARTLATLRQPCTGRELGCWR